MSSARRSIAAVFVVLPALGGACESRTTGAVDAGADEPSPNASILPAPLATAPERTATGAATGADAAVPSDAGTDAEAGEPERLREDRWLPEDSAELRETAGIKLKARFRWPDVPAAPRPPEANAEALDRARGASTFDVGIELGAGRLRLRLASDRFLLPEGTELRARSDRFGHVLLFPDGSRYVTVQAGALRAVLNEHRTDAVELTYAAASPIGNGRPFGLTSEKAAFVTPLGRLELEQARVSGSLDDGVTLCRLLLELAGAAPESSACGSELVPVRADYVFASGGRLLFETMAFERVTEMDPAALRVPPSGAEHRIGELPEVRSPLLFGSGQTRAFRNRPTARVEAKDGVREGLLLVNADDLPKYVLVDGVPVVRLPPGGAGVVVDLLPGSYAVSSRSFLSDELAPPAAVGVPSRFQLGTPSDSANVGSAR
jgi:hypothetical protein